VQEKIADLKRMEWSPNAQMVRGLRVLSSKPYSDDLAPRFFALAEKQKNGAGVAPGAAVSRS
jgi:hypothetical protein